MGRLGFVLYRKAVCEDAEPSAQEARATSYLAMQFSGKATAKEQSAGRDEHDAGSRERALNTAAYKTSRKPSR